MRKLNLTLICLYSSHLTAWLPLAYSYVNTACIDIIVNLTICYQFDVDKNDTVNVLPISLQFIACILTNHYIILITNLDTHTISY